MSWTQTRLRYVADLNPPVRPDLLQDPSREVSFLPMEAVGENGSLNLQRTRPVAEVRNGYSYFEDGDVAIAKVTPCFENGKGALMRGLTGGAGFGTTELTVLRPRSGVEARFLRYFLASAQFMAEATGAMTGAGGLKRVPDWFVRDYPARWPDTSTQERIANFLDEQTARIDALIAEKERLVGSLNENQQSHLLALVTGQAHGASGHVQPDRPHIEALPKDWKLPQLARLVSKLTNGYVGPTRDIFVENGVRYLQSLHIKGGFIDFGRGEYFVTEEWSSAHQKSVLTAGDVLIVQTGDIGQTALVTPDFVGCNCHALIIATPRRQVVRPEYLELVLRSPYGRASFDLYSTGALHPHLNCSNIRDIRVPLPPLFVQDEIVQRCAKVQLAHRELLSHVSGHIERLREYRSSLISAAVTGQLDIDSFEPQQVDSCEVALT